MILTDSESVNIDGISGVILCDSYAMGSERVLQQGRLSVNDNPVAGLQVPIDGIAYLERNIISHYTVLAAIGLLDEFGSRIHIWSIIKRLHETVVVIVSEYLSYMDGLNEFKRKSGFIRGIRGVTGGDCSSDVINTFAEHTKANPAFFATE